MSFYLLYCQYLGLYQRDFSKMQRKTPGSSVSRSPLNEPNSLARPSQQSQPIFKVILSGLSSPISPSRSTLSSQQIHSLFSHMMSSFISSCFVHSISLAQVFDSPGLSCMLPSILKAQLKCHILQLPQAVIYFLLCLRMACEHITANVELMTLRISNSVYNWSISPARYGQGLTHPCAPKHLVQYRKQLVDA